MKDLLDLNSTTNCQLVYRYIVVPTACNYVVQKLSQVPEKKLYSLFRHHEMSLHALAVDSLLFCRLKLEW